MIATGLTPWQSFCVTKLQDVQKCQARKIVFCWEVKKALGCKDCGASDPRVLQFHHRDQSTKLFVVGKGYNQSWASLREEIRKCDVLCVNCHRGLHDRDEDYSLLTPDEVAAIRSEAQALVAHYYQQCAPHA
jgi:hypothetical protein